MDAFTLAAKLTLDSGDFERDLGKQEGVFKQFGNKLGSAFSTVGKVGAAAIGAAATAVGALTKTAVESYAEYEQLVGGVETLFGIGGKSLQQFAKESGKTAAHAVMDYRKVTQGQRTVLQNAQKAYKTAGLSMNQYMETVTSFSASLIQSLSGDQAKAAKVADQAIIDMSDNANKMGTSMEAIQNAYQGFAKQNYTMLDNLKLGYGGTKTEMERLIADANKVKQANGEMADLSIERFSDVVEAIHIIQTEMGITGTTAEEAEKTISGSIGMMKASWENLVTALGNGNADIGPYIDNLVSSAEIAFGNIMPVVEKALTGIASFVEKIAPIIAEKLPGMVEDVLPKLLNAAGSILEGVINALPALFTTLFTAIGNIDWLSLGTSIWNTIKGAFEGIAGWFSEKFTAAKEAIGQINWLSVGSQAWAAIVEGIGNIRDWFTTAFNDASDAIKWIDWGSVGSSIWDFISAPFLAIADWFTNTFSTAASAAENNVPWQALGESIRGFIENGISAISETISGFFESAKTTIENINWIGVGTAIKNFVVSGINSVVTDLTNLFNDAAVAIDEINWVEVGTAIRETIQGAVEAISGWFGELFSGIITDTEELDWNGLGTAIVGYLESGLSAIDGLLTGLFGDEWTQIKTDAQESWSAIQSAVETAFSGIEAAWNGIVSFFTTTIPEVWNNLKTTAQETWDGIQSNITTAIDTAKNTLETTWGTIQSKAEEIWGALKTAAETAWQAIQGFIEDPISAAQETLGGIWTSIQSAVTEAWAAIETTITNVINAITTPINDFIGTVSSAVDGVLKFLGLKPSETPDWKSDVDNKITTPMGSASSAIQELLGEMASLEAKDGKNLASTTSTHTHTEHTIYTFEGSSGQEHTGSEGKFAKAMFGGKILRGATVFGMNDNGPMIGGEAGPEAIVGVNSLDQMIQKSVSNAVSGILAKMDSLISGQGTGNIEIVLDTGELVGAIGGKMDAELGKIGDWKGGGRA